MLYSISLVGTTLFATTIFSLSLPSVHAEESSASIANALHLESLDEQRQPSASATSGNVHTGYKNEQSLLSQFLSGVSTTSNTMEVTPTLTPKLEASTSSDYHSSSARIDRTSSSLLLHSASSTKLTASSSSSALGNPVTIANSGNILLRSSTKTIFALALLL